MESEEKWTEIHDRWEILTLSRLQQTLLHLTDLELPVTENSATRLILALAQTNRMTGEGHLKAMSQSPCLLQSVLLVC